MKAGEKLGEFFYKDKPLDNKNKNNLIINKEINSKENEVKSNKKEIKENNDENNENDNEYEEDSGDTFGIE